MLRRLLKPLAGRGSAGWRLLRSPALRHRVFGDPGDTLLFALRLDMPRATVVCLGANEVGDQDPLRPFLETGWRGLLVEPVPYVFRRLQERWGHNPRLLLENAAVAAATGTTTFHFVRESTDLPRGYDHLGSLSQELLRSHTEIVPELEGRLISATVPAVTFPDLLTKHRIAAFDLLVMDLEGFDYEVLKQVDFTRHCPQLVMYEHAFLSDADRAAARYRSGA